MNIIHKLTLRHLRLNKGRTAVTLAGIALSAALVCAVSGFAFSILDMLRRSTVEATGDFHILFTQMDPGTAVSVGESELFESYYTRDPNTDARPQRYQAEGVVNLYLKLAKPAKPFTSGLTALGEQYGFAVYNMMGYPMFYVNEALLTLDGGVFSEDTPLLMGAMAFLFAINLIMLCSMISISNAFYLSISERVRQFGLLKSAGATGRQIGRGVLFEALVLWAAATPIGAALGFGVQCLAIVLLKMVVPQDDFRPQFPVWVLLITAGVALVNVLAAAANPAWRAARTPAVDAIRQSKEVRVREHEFKVSRLTQKLFGFEGALAAKSLKRAREKHRSAVIALTMSVILFVAVSALLTEINVQIEEKYGPQAEWNAQISVTGTMARLDEADAVYRALPGATLKRWIVLYVWADRVDESFYTEQWRKHGRDDGAFSLSFLPDDVFSRIAPGAGAGAPEAGLPLPAILINGTGEISFWEDFSKGTTVTYDNIVPYVYTPGQTLPIMFGHKEEQMPFEAEHTLTLAAEVTWDSEWFDTVMDVTGDFGRGGLLLSETSFRVLCAGRGDIRADYLVDAVNPAAFLAAAEAVIPMGYMDEAQDSHAFYYEFDREARHARNLILAGTLAGYGFIVLLSLIAVSGVITTISTGVALRRREFALLYSAGMTQRGMSRMLNLESLLYAIQSLVIGLPAGLALSAVIIQAVDSIYLRYDMPPLTETLAKLPWLAALVSAAVVVLLSFGAMRYGRRRLKNVGIVEAIRDETT